MDRTASATAPRPSCSGSAASTTSALRSGYPSTERTSTEAAAAIIGSLRPPVCGVLITYLDQAEAIADFCRTQSARMVQVHGDFSAAELARLRELDPGLTIIKSLVVGRHPVAALERLTSELRPLVDGFITDTYAPQTGAFGATGRTRDWSVSRRPRRAGRERTEGPGQGHGARGRGEGRVRAILSRAVP